MSDPDQDTTWDRMLEQHSIEGLPESEWRELASRIGGDDQALRQYIEAVHWQQSLSYLAGEGPMPDRGEQIVDEQAAEKSGGADSTAVVPTTPSGAHRAFAQRERTHSGAWIIAASIAFLAGAGITAFALRGSEAPKTTALGAPQQSAAAVAVKPTQFTQERQLGKVSALSLEASADGLLRSLQVGQELRCGEVVQFTVGHMRVALHAGPELIIEGPAEFSIIGKEHVFVRVGRVTASDAKNLLLQSPLLTAECNDADVTFVADEDTSTNVYAHKGVVTMRGVARRESGNGKLAVLHEGHGMLVREDATSGETTKTAVDSPPEGIRSWFELEARLSDAQRIVLSDRPVAYWPLYRVRRNRRVLDLTQNGYDGQAIGNWPVDLNEAAKAELGAFFNGESYIEPDRKPPLDLRSGFTVEGWAKVSGGPEFQAIFTSRWVLDAHASHLQCLGFTLYAGKNDRWQFWTGSGRYGELWRELHSDAEIVRHRWTHVVGTFEPLEPADGMPAESIKGTVRIYADGQLVAQDVHEMSLLNFEWPARIGAAEFVPKSLTSWLFRGHLRDIAVYNYPLEPARIEAHYEAGKTAG